MAFRRDLILELGGFDEALDTGRPLPGGGDLDMFYRVVRSGNSIVYEPTFLVFHQHRRQLAELRRQYESWGRGFMAYVSKSMNTDPEMRSIFRELVRWWWFHQASRLKESFGGRPFLTWSMVMAEMWGGAKGILGEYRRSQQRIEKLKQETLNAVSSN